jgi:hypothetical protein
MTTFPNAPRLLKGGLILIDAVSGAVQRIIALQYNPDTLSRTLQVKGAGGEGGDHSEALRLKGPPVETIKLEAEIDAGDQLEVADPQTVAVGIHPQLAVLEGIIYPTSAQLAANNRLAQAGTLEIIPMQAPLALFVWSRSRVVPVRITDFSITEEAFDPNLNPLRARVSLTLRVLSVDDLGFNHRGSSLFMAYLQVKEQMAQRNVGGTFSAFGITGLP